MKKFVDEAFKYSVAAFILVLTVPCGWLTIAVADWLYTSGAGQMLFIAGIAFMLVVFVKRSFVDVVVNHITGTNEKHPWEDVVR